MNRPVTVIAATVLLLVIGASGVMAGLTLLSALPAAAASLDLVAAAPILLGIPLYGLLAIAGGIGVWRASRRGWWLAVAVDLFGLAILAWALQLGGPDGLLLFGVALWLLALGLLVAPATRRYVR